MIEKSYQYLCLKICNRIRGWLFNTACNLLQKEKDAIQLVDINMTVDVLNVMTLKHFPVKKIRVFSTQKSDMNIFKDKCVQYYPMNFLHDQMDLEKPDIIIMSFSINSMEMSLDDFGDICRFILRNGSVCIGTMYDSEYIEKHQNETNKIFKIEKEKENEYNLLFTYNLYGGMSISNRVIVYSKEMIKNIVDDIGNGKLIIEFTNFIDTGIVDENLLDIMKESLRTRTSFIIRKIKDTM